LVWLRVCAADVNAVRVSTLDRSETSTGVDQAAAAVCGRAVADDLTGVTVD
jgi:hypothetical protein